MKCFVAVSAVAFAALSSQATAADCDSSVLSALLTDPYIDQCATDSGYVFTAASIPTADVMALMCASSACNSLLADVTAMNLTECTLPVGDHINLLSDLVDYVPAHCTSTAGSTAAATTGSTATAATVGSSSTAGEDTVTAPASSTSSTASSTAEETSAPETASSAASASAAASASGSSAASPAARALGVVSFAAVAVGALFL
ncbi:hypothetical protein BBJ28_00003882 [Nothophytophthora sp. Chile5]|nr:hypothetical protein BBJ28_00003882 [Nothophytophthora sp. Chile5]